MEEFRLRRWGEVMDFLYSAGRKHVDPRYCRTHAYIAQLFAASPSSEFNAATWAYIAQAWNDLADFKETIARQKMPEWPGDERAGDPVHSAEEQPHHM